MAIGLKTALDMGNEKIIAESDRSAVMSNIMAPVIPLAA